MDVKATIISSPYNLYSGRVRPVFDVVKMENNSITTHMDVIFHFVYKLRDTVVN